MAFLSLLVSTYLWRSNEENNQTEEERDVCQRNEKAHQQGQQSPGRTEALLVESPEKKLKSWWNNSYLQTHTHYDYCHE